MKKEYLLTVDESGRIVIPKEVREELNITGKVKLVIEDSKIQLLPYVKKSFKGLFKVNVRLKDADEVLKEASEERSRKWSEGIST
jgi:AbrB family looped-hinge helix DNA binding protein